MEFRRKFTTLDLEEKRFFDGAIPIQELPVYPIKYATQDVLIQLKNRGQKFWNLRYQQYVSYTGWDVKEDENHVKHSLILQLDR